MKKSALPIISLIAVLVLSFGVLVQPASAGGGGVFDDDESMCQVIGGVWENGKCFVWDPWYCGTEQPWLRLVYDPDTGYINPTKCYDRNPISKTNFAEQQCEYFGGTYVSEGQCYIEVKYWSEGDAFAGKGGGWLQCNVGDYMVLLLTNPPEFFSQWYGDDYRDYFFTYWKFGHCSTFIPGQGGFKINDPGVGSGFLKNTEFQYEAQTCSGVCSIKQGVIPQAKADLGQIPGTIIKTVYVQIKDSSGDASHGSYQVCFGGNVEHPQVWKWFGSSVGWLLVSSGNCAYSDFGGNYAFVSGN